VVVLWGLLLLLLLCGLHLLVLLLVRRDSARHSPS
jgi:hypothetical protein